MSLDPLDLPSAGDWKTWLDERGRGGLREAAAQVERLKAVPAGDPELLERWNDAALALGNTFAVASLMSSVHPEPEVVELAEEIEVEARRYANDVHLDSEVYAQLSSLDADRLDADARRVLEDALRDFRRAGVDKEEATREELRRLNDRETELGQAFSRNIREGRRTARVPASALDGLPEDFRDAHRPDADGLVAITTEYPDVQPFLTFSRDAEARRTVAMEFFNIAWPENHDVLTELLRLRHEKATLLGYPDWPSYDAEVKMIGDGARIPEFIDDIARRADEPAHRELEVLLARARQDGVEQIDLSCSRHYLDTVQREQYGVDAQEVRRYFAFDKVHDGLLEVTGRLFGLRYEKVDVPTWHEEVTSYDVYLADGQDGAGERLGRIHLDLHPRERKYNHAAQFDLVPGVLDRQLPEGVLVCNFSRGLMEHQQVVTLFHEFGHLMHHVLAGRHRWVRFSGVATEWDFVEAPSQMLEEWAWDAGVLQTFATDEAGTPIPTELVEKMRAAEEFGKAFLARTQMFYAALSYCFHQERPDDLTGRALELYDQYNLVKPLPDTHFYTGFGHLEGYSSAYYTYMWSLVIAKDLFSAFDRDDLFAPEVARRYRDTILAAGGSRDAADLVEAFLGRPYDTAAFAAWLES